MTKPKKVQISIRLTANLLTKIEEVFKDADANRSDVINALLWEAIDSNFDVTQAKKRLAKR